MSSQDFYALFMTPCNRFGSGPAHQALLLTRQLYGFQRPNLLSANEPIGGQVDRSCYRRPDGGGSRGTVEGPAGATSSRPCGAGRRQVRRPGPVLKIEQQDCFKYDTVSYLEECSNSATVVLNNLR